MTTIKATRATIKLGNIELDVFQLPDGSYRWSAKQITEAIKIRHSRVAQISATKEAQSLVGKGLQVADFSPKKLVSDVGNISGYSTEVAFFVWQYESYKGNELAKALVFGSGVESLERRADAAFGILRTEEERNVRFSLIANSRVTRRSYTDILKDRLIKQYGEDGYKELAKNGYFKDITRRVNLHLFNTPHFKCDRENMDNDQLRDIELFEKQLERRANRFPDQTAEQLFQWMIDQF